MAKSASKEAKMKKEYETLLAVVEGYLDERGTDRSITFVKLAEIINTIENAEGGLNE
jgi:hypothetical protein